MQYRHYFSSPNVLVLFEFFIINIIKLWPIHTACSNLKHLKSHL